MASDRIELDLPKELREQLEQVAEALGIPTATEAAIIAVADWVTRRKSELDDRDPSQKYFINEGLDELINQKK
ncbi:MAG TPA: hypothetical protein VEC38_10070 [Candidatus Binataceae bacterium]|nr:hypothetical protein [Candidatus Binataceae bacterium]